MAILYPIGAGLSSPFGQFIFQKRSATLCEVQTVSETRRSRLMLLWKRHNQTMANLNEAIGWPRNDARLNRIKGRVKRGDREGKIFDMGDNIAREIEQALNLPLGWMDTPLTYAEIHGEDDPVAKALMVMENIPKDQWPTVFRLIDAISQPIDQSPAKTGTVG